MIKPKRYTVTIVALVIDEAKLITAARDYLRSEDLVLEADECDTPEEALRVMIDNGPEHVPVDAGYEVVDSSASEE